MMRGQQSQDSSCEDIDDHDAPTEPLMPVVLSPSAATIADEVIPTPTPHERPFPAQQASVPLAPYGRAPASVYPVLPPAPGSAHGNRQPPGGAIVGGYPVYPVSSAGPAQAEQAQRGRSPSPLFVGIFFVAVQLLLLVRFVLKLIALDSSMVWVSTVYAISGVFVLPFQLLLQNIAVSVPTTFEISTLLAILMYGLFSRVLVRFLKALLHSR